VFDDTPGQARVALQRHAQAHRGTAELNLGHLVHQTDNQRLGAVGLGAELKTEHGAAVRAARGLLVAAERAAADGSALDSAQAEAQVEQSNALQDSLAATAAKHDAKLANEPATDKLPAVAALAAAGRALAGTSTAGADGRAGSGTAAAYGRPQLQLYAPAGIAATTPASTVIACGATGSVTAGQDIGFAAQRNLAHSVKDGISLFTYGKAGSTSKPSQETGIRLHAASGKASLQSQGGRTRLTADKAVTVASVAKNVNVAAREHLLLTAQGAYIRLSGGDIEVHGPGTIAFKASMKEWAGPQSSALTLPALPKCQSIIDAHDEPLFSQQIVAPDVHVSTPEYAGLPYQIWQRGKAVRIASGTLDENGTSARVFTKSKQDLTIVIGEPTWEIITPVDSDPSPKGDSHD
jgi:uncharacterized protein (DUF2345 family)